MIASVALSGSVFGGRAAQAEDNGQNVFQKYCFACHTTERGRNRVGPSLYGVVDRQAGTATSSFVYSEALRDSGLTWTEATLDSFLKDPNAAIPGTKMRFSGIANSAERNAIIGYLKRNAD